VGEKAIVTGSATLSLSLSLSLSQMSTKFEFGFGFGFGGIMLFIFFCSKYLFSSFILSERGESPYVSSWVFKPFNFLNKLIESTRVRILLFSRSHRDASDKNMLVMLLLLLPELAIGLVGIFTWGELGERG